MSKNHKLVCVDEGIAYRRRSIFVATIKSALFSCIYRSKMAFPIAASYRRNRQLMSLPDFRNAKILLSLTIVEP